MKWSSRASLVRLACMLPVVSLPSLLVARAPPALALPRTCATVPSPSVTIKTCTAAGLDAAERLAGCAADETCIATSAVANPAKYAPPWTPPSVSPEYTDAARAFRALAAAVAEQPGVRVLKRDDERRYLLATAAATVPPDGDDEIEFVVRAPAGGQGATALFRTATRQAVFVYPLQQPLADQDSHSKRLGEIRRRLGWAEAGLGGDATLESNLGIASGRNFFGWVGGVKLPDYDEDYED